MRSGSAKDFGAELLVVDTLAFWADFKEGQEFDAGATGQAIKVLLEATTHDLAVLVTTHTRKLKQGERPSISAVFGSQRVVASADIPLIYYRSKLDSRTLLSYSRYPATPERQVGTLDGDSYILVGTGRRTSQRVGKTADPFGTDRVRNALPATPGAIDQEGLIVSTGLTQQQVSAAINFLCDGGEASCLNPDNGGRKGNPYRYCRAAASAGATVGRAA
jgi:hypothetical protein